MGKNECEHVFVDIVTIEADIPTVVFCEQCKYLRNCAVSLSHKNDNFNKNEDFQPEHEDFKI